MGLLPPTVLKTLSTIPPKVIMWKKILQFGCCLCSLREKVFLFPIHELLVMVINGWWRFHRWWVFQKILSYCQILTKIPFPTYRNYVNVRLFFTFWVYYADDPLNCVPILEFESPALGLFWIPVQDLELFSNWRPKVLWWFEVRARDFVCKKKWDPCYDTTSFSDQFLGGLHPKKKVQDKIFKIDYFIPNIFGYI